MTNVRVRRGFGLKAHTFRLHQFEALERANICRLVAVDPILLYGKGHVDYTVRIDGRLLLLRTREADAWIAGVAWGWRAATGAEISGLEDAYRPDEPIKPSRVTATPEPRRIRGDKS